MALSHFFLSNFEWIRQGMSLSFADDSMPASSGDNVFFAWEPWSLLRHQTHL